MYATEQFLTDAVGNNALSFAARTYPRLYIPKLVQITSLDDLALQTDRQKIAFEACGDDDRVVTCYGLKHIYAYDICRQDGSVIPCYIFDNHNHAYFFWHFAKHNKHISSGAYLYHIDEHADMRSPKTYLSHSAQEHLAEIYTYTQNVLNVGNFIVPAQKDGLVSEVMQIRSHTALETYMREHMKGRKLASGQSCILDVDIDFFQEELSYIPYKETKACIADIMQYADCITIATSPFFMDQIRALEIIRDIWGSYGSCI